jgi:NADH-quinone oxidoreductase subunit D
VRQCLAQIDGAGKEFWIQPKKLKPVGDAMARVEAARGDMSCYVVGDGGTNAYRARFRTGSFNAMGIIREKSRGLMVADLVALIASLDVVAPEIDR